MKTDQKSPGNIDDYIAGFSPDVQEVLQKVRLTIKQAAPDADETIKYQIPTFTGLLSFAAWKKHISLYPGVAACDKFQKELAPYKAAKSTARFPLDKPIPYPLISQLTKFRVKANLASVAAKAKKK